MPEEIEVPTEHLQETLEHHAEHAQEHGKHGGGEHGKGGEAPPKWIPSVALSAAVLSVLAAIAALFAGHHANEAMLDQIKASDNWAFYQSKGIKKSVQESKLELLEILDKKITETEKAKVETYEKDQEKIKESADEEEKSSADHMKRHVWLARAVTFLQVAIALAAISVLSRKKAMWYGSLVLGIGGAILMALGFLGIG